MDLEEEGGSFEMFGDQCCEKQKNSGIKTCDNKVLNSTFLWAHSGSSITK